MKVKTTRFYNFSCRPFPQFDSYVPWGGGGRSKNEAGKSTFVFAFAWPLSFGSPQFCAALVEATFKKRKEKKKVSILIFSQQAKLAKEDSLRVRAGKIHRRWNTNTIWWQNKLCSNVHNLKLHCVKRNGNHWGVWMCVCCFNVAELWQAHCLTFIIIYSFSTATVWQMNMTETDRQ